MPRPPGWEPLAYDMRTKEFPRFVDEGRSMLGSEVIMLWRMHLSKNISQCGFFGFVSNDSDFLSVNMSHTSTDCLFFFSVTAIDHDFTSIH